MGLVDTVTARMPRVTIGDLRSGEVYEMPLVPVSFTEELVVNFAKHRPVGLPHSRSQYTGTDDFSLRGLLFTFTGHTPEEVRLLHEGRKFLMSLCYPSRSAQDVRTAGPPRVLFVWPQMVSLTCRLERLQSRHVLFNSDGLSTRWDTTIDLTEIRDVRLSSEDVRRRGTIRSPGDSSAPVG